MAKHLLETGFTAYFCKLNMHYCMIWTFQQYTSLIVISTSQTFTQLDFSLLYDILHPFCSLTLQLLISKPTVAEL